MGTPLSRAPLYYVLAQVRYNDIPKLENYLPDLQEQFTKKKFALFERTELPLINFIIEPSGTVKEAPVEKVSQYRFSNIDKTAGFILSKDALSFQTTAYKHFSDFSENFKTGLIILSSILQRDEEPILQFSTRLGVRYLDAIFDGDQPPLTHSLQTPAQAMLNRLHGKLQHQFNEIVLAEEQVRLTTRILIKEGAIAFPPDLLPFSLKLPSRLQQQGLHATLDIDCAVEENAEFAVDSLIVKLTNIKSKASEAFKQIVTTEALTAWA